MQHAIHISDTCILPTTRNYMYNRRKCNHLKHSNWLQTKHYLLHWPWQIVRLILCLYAGQAPESVCEVCSQSDCRTSVTVSHASHLSGDAV